MKILPVSVVVLGTAIGVAIGQTPSNPQPTTENTAKPAPASPNPTPAPAVKFILSESEELTLRQLVARQKDLQRAVNELVLPWQQDVNRFGMLTLQAHGNPKDVTFDGETMTFKVNPPVPVKAEDKKGEKK